MGMRTTFPAGMRPVGKELHDNIEPLAEKEKANNKYHFFFFPNFDTLNVRFPISNFYLHGLFLRNCRPP